MPGFMPYSAVEKEKIHTAKKKGKPNPFLKNKNDKKGKKNFAEIYGKGKK